MSPWEPFRGLLGVPIVRYLFVLLSNLGGHKTGISITLGYYITEKTTLLSLFYHRTFFLKPQGSLKGAPVGPNPQLPSSIPPLH